MTLLIAGLFIWCVVHMFPSIFIQSRTDIVNRYSLALYKGMFALLIVASIVLMVTGWRSILPADIYYPAGWGRPVAFLLALFTFILFVAAKRKTNIKRIFRHPQLTGLILWSIGHLLANGDQKSLLLFATLGIWAILEMMLINRRVGTWTKPDPVPLKNDVITVLIGLILYIVLLLAHQYIAGVSLVII